MPAPPPVEALGVAAALTLFALALFLARLARGTGPSQVRRVLIPAAFFVLATVIVFGLPLLILAPASIMPLGVAIALAWLVPGALLTVWVLDGVAVTAGAERTPGWRTLGISGAVIANYSWLAALTGDLLLRLEPIAAAPALMAAGAALLWWPYLPRPEDDPEDPEAVDGIFE